MPPKKAQPDTPKGPASLDPGVLVKKITELSDSDKTRLVCAFLHSTVTSIDFTAAAETFGSASAASMAKMHGNTMKKLKPAEGSNAGSNAGEGDNGTPESSSAPKGPVQFVPKGANDGKKLTLKAATGKTVGTPKTGSANAGEGDNGTPESPSAPKGPVQFVPKGVNSGKKLTLKATKVNNAGGSKPGSSHGGEGDNGTAEPSSAPKGPVQYVPKGANPGKKPTPKTPIADKGTKTASPPKASGKRKSSTMTKPSAAENTGADEELEEGEIKSSDESPSKRAKVKNESPEPSVGGLDGAADNEEWEIVPRAFEPLVKGKDPYEDMDDEDFYMAR